MRVEGDTLVLDTCASTMDEARRLISTGDTGTAAVRARSQKAGRGQRGAPWHAPAGTCLLVTYVVRDVGPGDVATLGMRAGVAVAQSVSAVTGLAPQLKWPNDVLLGGFKVAGVLTETVAGTGVALVGVGLNANVDAFDGPLAATAVSLLLATGRTWGVDGLEAAVRMALGRVVTSPWLDVLTAWRSQDATAGRCYAAPGANGPLEGVALGVADDGTLVLRADDGAVHAVQSATAR